MSIIRTIAAAIARALKPIFTWWDGATIGTMIDTWLHGELVGTDAQGNRYYRSRRKGSGGIERRWVIYNGHNDSSRVPPEWHGWLHHSFDEVPQAHLPEPRRWEAAPTPNLTGTPAAYRPSGALERGGVRARAVGDYEPWTPEG